MIRPEVAKLGLETRADGVVVVDYDVWIGCRYCLLACAYDAPDCLGPCQ